MRSFRPMVLWTLVRVRDITTAMAKTNTGMATNMRAEE